MHEHLFGGWPFGPSGADGAGDARDLLSARHRVTPPHVSPLAGLEARQARVEVTRLKRENAVSDAQIGDIGAREDNQTSDT